MTGRTSLNAFVSLEEEVWRLGLACVLLDRQHRRSLVPHAPCLGGRCSCLDIPAIRPIRVIHARMIFGDVRASGY